MLKAKPNTDTTHPNGTLFPIGGSFAFLRLTFATAFPVLLLNIVNVAPVASAALHCHADNPYHVACICELIHCVCKLLAENVRTLLADARASVRTKQSAEQGEWQDEIGAFH